MLSLKASTSAGSLNPVSSPMAHTEAHAISNINGVAEAGFGYTVEVLSKFAQFTGIPIRVKMSATGKTMSQVSGSIGGPTGQDLFASTVGTAFLDAIRASDGDGVLGIATTCATTDPDGCPYNTDEYDTSFELNHVFWLTVGDRIAVNAKVLSGSRGAYNLDGPSIADSSATVDPYFEIDPEYTFEFDGQTYRASEVFELVWPENVVYSGPPPQPIVCPAASLQSAIDNAAPGDVILVEGTCSENFLVRNEKQRITIDGSGAGIGTRATLAGNSNSPAVNIRGKGILLRNFNISGGSNGVHVNRGSNAVVNNNVIEGSSGTGVLVDELAFAVITGNTIENHPAAGVVVAERSTARIGFNSDGDTVADANLIKNNGGFGIHVSNGSSARIVANTIQDNVNDGIQVVRDSHADIAGNGIYNNADGIEVGENSTVQLGEDGGTSMFEAANSSAFPNNGFGVNCVGGGSADGRLGSLAAAGGAKSFDASCIDSLAP
jgi:hypothetical protein